MAPQKVKAYLSLGSNMGDREALLGRAAALLGERCGVVTAVSKTFETDPEGFRSPHLFYNIALALETTLSPHGLLSETQEIERELGRTHKSRDGVYADRPIDIDLILYGDLILDTPELTVPHPRFRERLFVLKPLTEIASETVDPVSGKKVSELLWDVS